MSIKTPLIYIAGPYNGDVETNIIKAENVSIALIRNGWFVFTPHKNTAGYEKYEDGKNITIQTWIDMDLDMLERCDALYVMREWMTSIGTCGEISYATELGIPIFFEDFHPPRLMTISEYYGQINNDRVLSYRTEEIVCPYCGCSVDKTNYIDEDILECDKCYRYFHIVARSGKYSTWTMQ